MAIDNKKLAILIIIGLIAFSLFAYSGEAALKKSNDYDSDGIPNQSDPHPNEARWTDWFGYLGEDGQDLIFGILLFLLLSFILWFAVGSVFKKMGHDSDSFAIKGIAVTMAGAATVFSYGSPVWRWWRGLFKLSPFIILFVVLALAIMVGVVHFLSLGKQVQKKLGSYRKEKRTGLKQREKTRAAERMARLQKRGSERIESLAEQIIRFEGKAYQALLKIKGLLVMASRADKGAQRTYYKQIMKEVGIGAKIGLRLENYTNKIKKFQNRLIGYLNRELFVNKQTGNYSVASTKLENIERHLDNEDKVFGKHNYPFKRGKKLVRTSQIEEKLSTENENIQRKIRAYAQDIQRREQWRRKAYTEAGELIGAITGLVSRYNGIYASLRKNLRQGNIPYASKSVDKAIAVIIELNKKVKQLDNLEREEETQDLAVLKEEKIMEHLENVVYKDVIKEIKLAKKTK